VVKHRVPTIIAIIFLMVGIVTGVLLIQQRQVFKLSAAGDLTPKDVRVSNVTENSFTVSWFTDRDSVGSVVWGENTDLNRLNSGKNSSPKKIHYITTRDLEPETSYYFEINSGGESFNNSNVPWAVKTAPKTSRRSEVILASGKVQTSEGSGAPGVVVYMQIGGASLASVQASSNGTWLLPLTNIRTQTLSSLVEIKAQETLLDIFVQGGSLGAATAQVFPQNANPTPDITLGQSFDFRSTSQPAGKGLPSAEIDLPEAN